MGLGWRVSIAIATPRATGGVVLLNPLTGRHEVERRRDGSDRRDGGRFLPRGGRRAAIKEDSPDSSSSADHRGSTRDSSDSSRDVARRRKLRYWTSTKQAQRPSPFCMSPERWRLSSQYG